MKNKQTLKIAVNTGTVVNGKNPICITDGSIYTNEGVKCKAKAGKIGLFG